MAPAWSRFLLYPEQMESKAAPMWARRGAGGLISLDPTPAPSQMWEPASNGLISLEPSPSPSQMWVPVSGVPVCPCCMTAVAAPAPRPSTQARPSTSSSAPSTRSLRSMPSSLGLRIKRSFANLRKKPSASTL